MTLKGFTRNFKPLEILTEEQIEETGRGTTELTNESRVDILISTLGKALGVNGGYLVSDEKVKEYSRETAPFYIYSNPITMAEASAALKTIEILDSEMGKKMLSKLHETATYFKKGLVDLRYETIEGKHPIVPLMAKDTRKTIELVNSLKEKLKP